MIPCSRPKCPHAAIRIAYFPEGCYCDDTKLQALCMQHWVTSDADIKSLYRFDIPQYKTLEEARHYMPMNVTGLPNDKDAREKLERMGKETAELIAELRNFAEYGQFTAMHRYQLVLDAAATLAARDAEIVRLREALKPFCKAVENADANGVMLPRDYVTNKHIRSAAFAAKGK